MLKTNIWLWLFFWGLSASTAQACKPVFHENPARDFIQDSRPTPTTQLVIFVGEFLSVSDHRDSAGNIIRDTTFQVSKWWISDLKDPVSVRSTALAALTSCGPQPGLEAKVGEQWLVFGWVSDGRITPYLDSRVTMPLTNGRIPPATLRELDRIKRPAAVK
jgi:hypothetical protein